MKKVFLFLSFFTTITLNAQIKPVNGLKESQPEMIAFKNAKILLSPDKTIENGTILIQGDSIIDVGSIIFVPNEALVVDCSGKTIIPSFIETWSSVGLPSSESTSWSSYPQLESSKSGAYSWNESIKSETNASSFFQTDFATNEQMMKYGFGLVISHNQDGIARGSGVLSALGNGTPNELIIKRAVAQFYSFDKGTSQQTYPSSQMGSIALLRQTFHDMQWYASTSKHHTDLSLEALESTIDLPFIFKTEDKLEISRAEKIADEFGFKFNYFGSGNEYEAIESLKKIKGHLILPINFPAPFDVKDPYVARQVALADLKHWELAPSNPNSLAENNIPFCISSYGQQDPEGFWQNIYKAMNAGLSAESAMAALTTAPAKMLNLSAQLGTLEKGKVACFSIYDSNPFEGPAVLKESCILGKRYIHNQNESKKIAGTYSIQIENTSLTLQIEENNGTLSGKLLDIKETKTDKKNTKDTTFTNVYLNLSNDNITIQFVSKNKKIEGNVSLHGKIKGNHSIFEGDGLLADGRLVYWMAIKVEKSVLKEKDEPKLENDNAKLWYPNMSYGFLQDEKPEQQTIVIKNATVWTNTSSGIVENATVIVVDGKIASVGTGNFSYPFNAKIIDAAGKHLTSGIIDEHSHIAISKGVNEGGQSVTAEVSIGDVIDPEDISIYRQLAGGVTAAQLLHGSANPIGGQSALIKLKWGVDADEMLIDNAPKFIKCALGENVKQANWGDNTTVRFPQTRMGVEQVFLDGFNRALEYEAEWGKFNTSKNNKIEKPRKDLELEVLLEILKSQRFITCHSYVQSEINMLMHLADSFGFKVNTFTHILEGYKLADKMLQHGVGASTFSDWWAYKFEVNDAIPYNASLMNEQGLVVAINSDDAEMGRRLNQEAAKGIKYGGMSEEDAWKMVTLNPAKLLHLDDKMGSVELGKDADLVLWSNNPLGIEAVVQLTMIEGTIYYDIQKDVEMQNRISKEKARILGKMIASIDSGEKTIPYKIKKSKHFHCDTLGEDGVTTENTH
jgi:imidazolonepropionase-like amidohydrolase